MLLRQKNKYRLYVAVYLSKIHDNNGFPGDQYYWGFLVGPKVEDQEAPGASFRIHMKIEDGKEVWKVDRHPGINNIRSAPDMLARMLIAKVEDPVRLVRIIMQVDVDQEPGSPRRSADWVHSVIHALQRDNKTVGTSMMDWRRIKARTEIVVAENILAERYGSAEKMSRPAPTWDLICDQQVLT